MVCLEANKVLFCLSRRLGVMTCHKYIKPGNALMSCDLNFFDQDHCKHLLGFFSCFIPKNSFTSRHTIRRPVFFLSQAMLIFLIQEVCLVDYWPQRQVELLHLSTADWQRLSWRRNDRWCEIQSEQANESSRSRSKVWQLFAYAIAEHNSMPFFPICLHFPSVFICNRRLARGA